MSLSGTRRRLLLVHRGRQRALDPGADQAAKKRCSGGDHCPDESSRRTIAATAVGYPSAPNPMRTAVATLETSER